MIRVKIADVALTDLVDETEHVAVLHDDCGCKLTRTIDIWLTDDDGVPQLFDTPSNLEECLCEALIVSDAVTKQIGWLPADTYEISAILYSDCGETSLQITHVEVAPPCLIHE